MTPEHKEIGKSGDSIRRILFVSLLGFLIAGFVSTTFLIRKPVRAAVTLLYFHATGHPGSVVLDWETATEIDNAGFVVNRSNVQNSDYQRISEFIAAKGDPLLGARYTYTDTNVVNGEGYWYKLEAIDNRQISDFYEPPEFAIPGTSTQATLTATQSGSGQLTATRTSTPVRTITKTPTPTTRSSSIISTQSFSGQGQSAGSTGGSLSQQSTQGDEVQTPESASIDSSSGLNTDGLGAIFTATATLIPLPDITPVFPDAALVGNQLPTPPSFPSFADRINGFSPNQLLFFALILFVWFFLGGWFYITLRQVER